MDARGLVAMLDGANATLPIVADSPYQVRDGSVFRNGLDLGLSVEPVRRPRFYDLTTADGVPYQQIALLHGKDVLATTVVQTCIRYDEPTRCRFCSIEESLRSGATIAAKTPAQLAEVAEAAVRSGVARLVERGHDAEAARRKLAVDGSGRAAPRDDRCSGPSRRCSRSRSARPSRQARET